MARILVSRTDAIGDLLLATPLIRELKKANPSNRVAVLTDKYAAPVLYNNPDVDEVIEYDKESPQNAYAKIKRGAFDAVIAAYPRFSLALQFWRSGIKDRYGTAYRWYSSFLFNKRIQIHRKESEMSEADYNLLLAAPIIGGKKAEKEYYYPSAAELEYGQSYAAGRKLTGKFVIIHPGSGGSSLNLSIRKYAELALLAEDRGMTVLLTGGTAAEKQLNSAIREDIGSPRVTAMTEDVKIRDFAGIIACASAFVSGSTGPMHIAAALGVPTVSFFPPDFIKATKAARWGPLGNKSFIIKPENNSMDMDSIDTEFAVNIIQEAAQI